MDNEPFLYEPPILQACEIRLIRLSSRKDESQPVLCTMKHVTLPTDFVTLSYTWGNTQPIQTIYIDGNPFLVGQNLYNFLASISLTGYCDDKWIWIDQICINQKNLDDRNQQVSQMGGIYKGANEVIAWLGRATARSDYWLDLIKHDRMPAMVKVDEISKFWAEVTSNPYWCRVWIAQEVVLARRLTVLLGSKDMGIERLQPYLEVYAIYANAKSSFQAYRGLSRILKLLSYRASCLRGDLDWLAAMALTEFANCKETLDYVYGLNALVAQKDAVEVDYGAAPEYLFFLVMKASYPPFTVKQKRMALQTQSMSTNKISPGIEFHDFARSLQRRLGLADDRDVNAFLHWSIKEQALLNNPRYLDHIEYMLGRSALQLPMVEHDANMAEDHMDRLISWHVFQDLLNESA